MVACVKEEKSGEIAKGNFSKITETAHWASSTEAAYSEHFNSYMYLFNFNGELCKRRISFCLWQTPSREASSFCDFWKLTSCDFTRFFSFFTQANLCFQMCLIRITIIAKLCLNMINFDAVDFSECRSEEVISFFWCSVYLFPHVLYFLTSHIAR